MNNVFIFCIALILILAGCNGNTSNKQDNKASTKVEESTINKEIVLSDISLQIPKGWEQEQPDNSMRVAQLSIGSNSEYKLVVFHFGQQDMIEANIDRWKKQFTEIESSNKLTLTNDDITGLKIVGKFKKKPFPMSQEFLEESNYGMLAAIVPSSVGPYYFRLSAPKEIILQHENEFVDLLNSYRQQ